MIDKSCLGHEFSFKILVPNTICLINETKNTETVTNVLLLSMSGESFSIMTSRHQLYFKVDRTFGCRPKYILHKLVEMAISEVKEYEL